MNKESEERHCSYCKHYECLQSRFMFCKIMQHRIYASRKNGCKHFESMYKPKIKKDESK